MTQAGPPSSAAVHVFRAIRQFEEARDPAVLDGDEVRQAAAALAGNGQDPVACLPLGWYHWYRYQILPEGQDEEELEAAIAAFAVVYRAIPPPLRGHLAARDEEAVEAARSALNNQANDLLRRARQEGDAAALSEGISLYRRALDLTPAGHSYRAAIASNLGSALLTRYEHQGVAGDLDDAVRISGDAVASVPAAHPDRAAYLSNLCFALRTRYERTGALDDLDAAVQAGREAADATADDHPDRSGILSALATTLRVRSEHTGDLPDLDESVSSARAAVAATGPEHPDPAAAQANLSSALFARYERTGDPSDLDEAITTGRQAVRATGATHPDRPGRLSNLGGALRARYERSADTADLAEAVDVAREAVSSTPPDHAGRAMYLSNLSNVLCTSYGRSGRVDQLDQAITAGRAAVAATDIGHPARPAYLCNVGACLDARYLASGSTADLDEVIDVLREAVGLTPDGEPERAKYLSSLGGALRARFERTRLIDDLNAAVDAGRGAVHATPGGHPDLPGRRSNLAQALRTQAGHAGSLADLDEAIALGAEAVAATPIGHPDRAMYLSNLGVAWQTRHDRTGADADLDQAIAVAEQAVFQTPTDHPGRAGRLANLGIALSTRHERSGDPDAAAHAADTFAQAATLAAAPAEVRCAAARRWGELAAELGDPAAATTAYSLAVELLPRLAHRAIPRSDQQRRLAARTGTATAAAAAALNAGHPPELAAQLLEQGRGVLLGQALDARTDLTSLRQDHPALADEYTRLHGIIDTAGAADWPEPAFAPTSDLRHRAGEQLTALVATIRRLPGFTRFLLPPTADELAHAADAGAIAVINISPRRCDALLVTPSGVDCQPLPGLTADEVTGRANRFLAATRTGSDDELRAILAWLWYAVDEPVLTALGFTTSTESLPRIWWLPTGPLSVLPLHAAGAFAGTEPVAGANALDRVVSSYTPTIRALTYVRARTAGEQGTSLTVAMPATPATAGREHPDLPAASREAAIAHAFRGGTLLTGPEATRRRVLAELAGASWAHFACHASSDTADPSRSHLALFDGALTAADVGALRLTNAAGAYLSACATAFGGTRLIDESIHASSSFQLAGFRHVIATLWPVEDLAAGRFAREVYQFLAEHPGQIAHAVHHASGRLRARHVTSPRVWASHVHAGP